MKNLLSVGLVLVAVVAFGQVNEHGNKNFTGEINMDGTLALKGTKITSTAAELNIMDGVTATASEINKAADVSAGESSASMTNGQALTLLSTDTEVTISGIGGANGTTNTITLALPYPVGLDVLLRVAATSTNKILLADSTTVLDLGANVVLSAGQSLRIYTTATNAATAHIYHGYNLIDGTVPESKLAAEVAAKLITPGAAAASNVVFSSTLGTNTLYFGAGGVFISNTWVAAGE